MTKYRLNNETRLWRWQDGSTPCTTPLRQMIAVKDFNDVTSGTKGGWVEDEHALAQDGDCWVYDENSVVFAGARISGNARLTQPRSQLTHRRAYVHGILKVFSRRRRHTR